MSAKVKLGIAGCGPGGVQVMYGPIVRYLETGVVTALMDPNPAALEYMARSCPDARTFTDYDEFLADGDIDAVVIGSPPFLHCEQTIQAAGAGKHVLCQKPFARTVAECDAMISACRDAHVVLMTAFMKRFDKSFCLAKQMIDAGELGQVFQVRCDWSFWGGDPRYWGWRSTLPTWGGLFADLGSHTIDLCRWWLGEVETVSGEIRIVQAGREVEDTAIATLGHAGGAISLHHQTAQAKKRGNEYYLIDGSKASLEIEWGPPPSMVAVMPFHMTLHQWGNTCRDVTPYNILNLDDEQRTHARYLKELEHFCDCILNGTPPINPGEAGRAAIMAINAVYVSSWRQTKIPMPFTEAVDLEAGFRAMSPMHPD